jgi:hypothetical protein
MASRTIRDYEDLIETGNAKECPNEKYVAFWERQMGVLRNVLLEEKQREHEEKQREKDR